MVRTKSLIAPVVFLAAAIVGCATGTDGGSGDPAGTGNAQGSDEGGAAAPTDSDAGSSGGGGGGSDSGSGGNGGNTDSGSGGGTDSGGGGGTCTGYADPTTKANCIDTQYCGGSKPACNPNGCDGTGASAYWCELSTKKCVKKPSGC